MRLLILFLFGWQILQAQEEELTRVMEDQASQEDAKEVEEDLQQLQAFVLRPVNLNAAVSEDLAVFPFLTALHIEQFILYRKFAGKLVDTRELQAVPGWSAAIIRRIIPFVTVKEIPSLQSTLSGDLRKGKQQVLLRSALAANAGILIRYQFSSPHLQFGVNTEKDAGERFWQGRKGISYLSAHLMLKNFGMIKTLVIGDYIINIGQGLMLWQGRAVRKTALPIMIKRQLPVLMPYRSNDENRYFKGAAIQLAGKNKECVLFMSMNKLDANIQNDTITKASYVTSFLNTGYHRDPGELADKNAVTHLSAGATALYNYKRLRVGISSVFHSFSLPVFRATEAYNLFSSRGKTLLNSGVSYHYTLRNLHVFGEFAIDGEGDPATINGLMLAADQRLDLSLALRKISRGYRSFFANAFTESSEPQNEAGMYTGLSFRLSPKLTLDAYADHYRFPWLRYRVDAPASGRDYMLQFSFKPDKRTAIYIRYRSEVKSQSYGPGQLKAVQELSRYSARIHIEHRVDPAWEWRFRLEFNGLNRAAMKPETGFIMYADLFWTPLQKPFAFNLRIMTCETSSYESRIYAFENDVMYYNIVPAVYGRYGRLYVNTNIDISERLKAFIKIAKNFPDFRREWLSRVQFIYSF